MSLVFKRALRAASVVLCRKSTISFHNHTQLLPYNPLTKFSPLEPRPFNRLMASAADSQIRDLTIPEVLAAGKKGTPIIDVREQLEIHNTGLIPGSVNIPLGHLEEALSLNDADFKERFSLEKPKQGDPIIMSCQSGNRSKRAIMALQQKGYTNLFNNAGGWKAYEEFAKQ